MGIFLLEVMLFYLKRTWQKERSNSQLLSDQDHQARSKCIKFPKNKEQRRKIIFILILIALDIIDKLFEFFDEIVSYFADVETLLTDPDILLLIIYSVRAILDGILSLFFLYIGYTLTMKMRANSKLKKP